MRFTASFLIMFVALFFCETKALALIKFSTLPVYIKLKNLANVPKEKGQFHDPYMEWAKHHSASLWERQWNQEKETLKNWKREIQDDFFYLERISIPLPPASRKEKRQYVWHPFPSVIMMFASVSWPCLSTSYMEGCILLSCFPSL